MLASGESTGSVHGELHRGVHQQDARTEIEATSNEQNISNTQASNLNPKHTRSNTRHNEATRSSGQMEVDDVAYHS